MTATLFDLCTPREDVRQGTVRETEFAADLARVIRGEAPDDYRVPARFFANTHPTRGLRELLRSVLARLSGSGTEIGAVFRLHTNFGGGKTHGLIALVHAARGMAGVRDAGEFVDPALLPRGEVRVAAFDGENTDPANGRPLPDGGRAYTPWGEIAYALAGRQGFERVRRSDELQVAPGADTIRELFGDGPALILIDELAPYLRKLTGLDRTHAREQLAAFLTALIKAVEASPRAALVLTLAVGKEGKATDAYAQDNLAVLAVLDELESIVARKATILNPTEDDETVRILRRRLFAAIDDAGTAELVRAYGELWRQHARALPEAGIADERLEAFRAGYPFHPELIATLREKTSSLGKFQRVRGMLRLLGRTVHRLWAVRPADAHAVHTHHIDLGFEPIRQELTTRIEQSRMVSPLLADVAAGPNDPSALAQQLDRKYFAGLPPYASYVARTIFAHTLAYPESNAGIEPAALRYALLSPGTDLDLVESARRRFVEEAAFLDDRPGAPHRFLTEPNLTQIIRRQEGQVEAGREREQLRDRIRDIFRGATLNLVPFPGGAWDVPDDAGNGRPYLVLIHHEHEAVDVREPRAPELVARVFRHKGGGNDFRQNRNNLVFVVADAGRVERLRELMRRRLALDELKQPGFAAQLPEHQRQKVAELAGRTETELAVAVQQAYRHVFYPSRHRMEGAPEGLDLAHTAIETTASAVNPGDGQRAVVERLRELGRLRLPEDHPDAPVYIRDRTPLRKGPITTAELRAEFRRDPSLPMLVGDDVFVKLIRAGIVAGEYVYRRGDLIGAKGLPPPGRIEIDEQSLVMTAAYAREQGIWPKPEPEAPEPEPPSGRDEPAGTGQGAGADRRQPPSPPPPPERSIQTEGVLREALSRLFEEAGKRGWTSLASLELRPFEARDAFTLSGLVGLVPKAQKRVTMSVEYETASGSACAVTFEGSAEDVKPVREFLQAQLNGAKDHDVECRLRLDFEGGLSLAGSEPAQLTERLARAGAGAAQVTAIAEPGA